MFSSHHTMKRQSDHHQEMEGSFISFIKNCGNGNCSNLNSAELILIVRTTQLISGNTVITYLPFDHTLCLICTLLFFYDTIAYWWSHTGQWGCIFPEDSSTFQISEGREQITNLSVGRQLLHLRSQSHLFFHTKHCISPIFSLLLVMHGDLCQVCLSIKDCISELYTDQSEVISFQASNGSDLMVKGKFGTWGWANI